GTDDGHASVNYGQSLAAVADDRGRAHLTGVDACLARESQRLASDDIAALPGLSTAHPHQHPVGLAARVNPGKRLLAHETTFVVAHRADQAELRWKAIGLDFVTPRRDPLCNSGAVEGAGQLFAIDRLAGVRANGLGRADVELPLDGIVHIERRQSFGALTEGLPPGRRQASLAHRQLYLVHDEVAVQLLERCVD